MKTFVLAATVLVLPTALSAQVLLPSGSLHPDSPVSFPEFVPITGSEEPRPTLVAERAPPPPPTVDYKLSIIQPPPHVAVRMRIVQPNNHYDYKLLLPQVAPASRAKSHTPRRR